MRISLLHYSAPPIVGGVESVLDHHARLMADDGHEVQIIAARGQQVDPRVKFLEVPLADSRHADILAVKGELDAGTISQKFHDLTQALERELEPLLSETDILIAHNVCSLNKNLPLTAALFNLSQRINSPHFILWHHDLAWTTPRYQNELHEGHPWDLLKTAWPNAKQVTISEMRRDELSELMHIDKSQIELIPNGVDVGKFLKLEAQTLEYVTKLNLLAASPLFLLPVRITPRKNVELALEILSCLHADFPDARMVVTGPLGPHNPSNISYFKNLLALRKTLKLEGHVHFLAEVTKDYIPDAVISDFYQLADALLFPSLEEGFGIPILEAGLAGRPVFCSDIEPLQKLGGEFVHYFSVHEKPEVIAQGIGKYFSENKVHGLRTMVRETFTWERVYQTAISPLIQD
jgi:glycosyltransferase involved in cell wall biosynthesis